MWVIPSDVIAISGDVMYARDPAEAVEVLDLLLKFFGNGER